MAVSDKLRVLLVEDSPDDAALVLRELRRVNRAIEHVVVDDAKAMQAALADKPWDLVISDWSMPRFSALRALEVLKTSQLDLPFIIVSGTVGEEHAVDAMRQGAHDYVLKDKLARLVPAVERELRECGIREARRREVVERARMVDELRASERRYRRIIETTNEGVWLIDADAKTTFMNDRMATMLGRGLDDLTGESMFDFIDPATHGATARSLATYRGGVGAQDAMTFLRRDGSKLHTLVESTPIFGDGGAFEGVLNMVMDMTSPRHAEAALRASEARFARLTESGIIGVAIASTSGRAFEANDALLRMLGYARADLATLRWPDLTPPEWRASDATAAAELERKGFTQPWEKELVRKDGSRVPVLIGIAMVEPPSFIAFIADLSAQKRAEEALRRSEEQLRQAQKLEAVGRLAGGVAHDFNNILSVILSYVDLLAEGLGTGPLRGDLEEIRNAGERAAVLTKQLLMFSRHQTNRPTVIDLDELIGGMATMLRRLVGDDIELVARRGATLTRVRADAGLIEQVIVNLAVNAREAMPSGGTLTIETEELELDDAFAREHLGVTPGPHIRLALSDTGKGLDPATQARLFEPFYTTKETGKSGLGLSTVFGIVRQAGGTIWVRSEIGAGTTLEVYLPATVAIAEARPTRAAVTGGVETILVVEDEDQVRVVACGILRRNGYQVIEARDAGEALTIAEAHAGPIHLLLSDVVMPRMSGPELGRRLVGERPAMKVLCMSGYTDTSIVRRDLLDDDIPFLQKPITPETLARKVRDVLDAG